jgi:hypothetical protein
MGRGRKIAAAAGALLLAGVLAGCGDQQRDLNGVKARDPDKYELYTNIDSHPNIARLCIDGVAFATISRDYNSILRVPE